jgi:hypothetical protein
MQSAACTFDAEIPVFINAQAPSSADCLSRNEGTKVASATGYRHFMQTFSLL